MFQIQTESHHSAPSLGVGEPIPQKGIRDSQETHLLRGRKLKSRGPCRAPALRCVLYRAVGTCGKCLQSHPGVTWSLPPQWGQDIRRGAQLTPSLRQWEVGTSSPLSPVCCPSLTPQAEEGTEEDYRIWGLPHPLSSGVCFF